MKNEDNTETSKKLINNVVIKIVKNVISIPIIIQSILNLLYNTILSYFNFCSIGNELYPEIICPKFSSCKNIGISAKVMPVNITIIGITINYFS
jgi:hypothetical protein